MKTRTKASGLFGLRPQWVAHIDYFADCSRPKKGGLIDNQITYRDKFKATDLFPSSQLFFRAHGSLTLSTSDKVVCRELCGAILATGKSEDYAVSQMIAWEAFEAVKSMTRGYRPRHLDVDPMIKVDVKIMPVGAKGALAMVSSVWKTPKTNTKLAQKLLVAFCKKYKTVLGFPFDERPGCVNAMEVLEW